MATNVPTEQDAVKVSPILVMARRAAERRAAGQDIVDLTLGEPDCAPPSHVADPAIAAAHRPLCYTPSNGMPALRSAARQAIARITAIQGQNGTQTATLSQIAAIAAVEGPQDILPERDAIYRERRDNGIDALSASPFLDVPVPDGAFYLFPKRIRRNDDVAVADMLFQAGGTTVPGRAFGASGHLRLSFAKDMATLKDGCKRIVMALEDGK